jgi:glycogen(starch) synthase
MKILMMSYAYPPSTGGIETFSSLMREAFVARGHEVRVVTEVASPMPEDAAHRVQRRPLKADLKQAIRWAEICMVCGVSLRFQIPALIAGKPLTITHQAWQEHDDGTRDNLQRLKLFVSRFGLNIAVNSVLARDLKTPALVIPNPLRGEIDLGPAFAERPRDVVFLGRLVREKGVAVLTDALARLHASGRAVTTTIIGDGPLRAELERQAAATEMPRAIEFAGRMAPAEFQPLLRQHKIMVVPSVYKEAFGIVTLEGLAAGCMTLVSQAGGLPEAVGPCGLTFPAGDSAALAALIQKLLDDPASTEPFREKIPAHVESFRPEHLGDRYLAAFDRLHFYHAVKRIGRGNAIRRVVEELATENRNN